MESQKPKKPKKDPERIIFSARNLSSRKPPKSGHYFVWNRNVPHHCVKVNAGGALTHGVNRRLPGNTFPSFLKIGPVATIRQGATQAEMDEADRINEETADQARQWNTWIDQGKHPRKEEERIRKEAERAEEQARQEQALKDANTLASSVDEYFKVPRVAAQRQAKETRRLIDREIVGVWGGDRSVHTLDQWAAEELIEDIVNHEKPALARNVLTAMKGFSRWASRKYRIPDFAAGINPRDLIGQKKPRQQMLNEDEVRAYWNAAEKMGGAWGDWFQVLMRTAVRKNEAAEARARELDLTSALPTWTIPPERFKSDCQHIVPLTKATADIFRRRKKTLSDREDWDFLFSVRQGEKPIGAFSKAKAKMDELMGNELGRPVSLNPWRVHDVRRTVRTHLAGMQISDNVAELILGHGPKDPIQRNYNLWKYQSEMREALEAWDQRLDEIVKADPSKVARPDFGAASEK